VRGKKRDRRGWEERRGRKRRRGGQVWEDSEEGREGSKN
jgi:hypothetical protein